MLKYSFIDLPLFYKSTNITKFPKAGEDFSDTSSQTPDKLSVNNSLRAPAKWLKHTSETSRTHYGSLPPWINNELVNCFWPIVSQWWPSINNLTVTSANPRTFIWQIERPTARQEQEWHFSSHSAEVFLLHKYRAIQQGILIQLISTVVENHKLSSRHTHNAN